jgi:hypothetical protein
VWAKASGKGSAHQAKRILLKMERLWQRGAHNFEPSIVTYNTVLNALVKSGEKGAAENAEIFLQHIVERNNF